MSSVKQNLRMVVALWAATIAVLPAARAERAAIGPVAVKLPEMSIPPGTKPGTLRRIIQPFGTWTLICDENLKARTRVCNVSQTLVDKGGRTVFSWSLAASQGGAPLFVLRLPAALARDHFVQVVFGKKDATEAGVILSTCNADICLGYLEVDPKIKRRIGEEASIQIKVMIDGHVQTFDTTLSGMKEAVASLK